MISFESALKLMEDRKLCCVKICDMHDRPIISFDDYKDVTQTVQQLRSYEELICGYGKVIFKCGTEAQKNGNYKGAAIWTVTFTKPGAVANALPVTSFSPMNQLKEMLTMMQLMQGMGIGAQNNNPMALELEKLKLQMEHEKKLRELEKQNEDPFMKYGHMAPIVMSLMGKDDASIEKMIKWGMMGKNMTQGTPATQISGTSTTLSFSDVDRMTDPERDKKICDLIAAVLTKVNADHFIQLLKKLAEKPILAVTAVNALSMIPASGEAIQSHTATTEQIDEINRLLDIIPGEEGNTDETKGVSAHHMIILLDAVNKDPGILKKALPLLANL